MDQIQVSDKDVQNPMKLRMLLQRSLGHSYDLLERLGRLEGIIRDTQHQVELTGASSMTPGAAIACDRYQSGSTDNPVSAQNAVVPA